MKLFNGFNNNQPQLNKKEDKDISIKFPSLLPSINTPQIKTIDTTIKNRLLSQTRKSKDNEIQRRIDNIKYTHDETNIKLWNIHQRKKCFNLELNNNKHSNSSSKGRERLPLIGYKRLHNNTSEIVLSTISNSYTLFKASPFNRYEDIRKENNCYETISIAKNILNQSPPTFYYYVNFTYRKQIPDFFKHRINWKRVEKKNEHYNLRWKYYAKKVEYKDYQYNQNIAQEKLKMINVFEKYTELGNKKKFLINMMKYCNKMNLNPFDYIPFSFILTKRNNFDLNLKSLEELMTLLSLSTITTQTKKNEDMIITKALYTDKFFNEIPLFLDNIYISIPKSYLSENNYWIIKPIDLYQGIGMKVTNKIEEIKAHSSILFTGMEKITAEEEEKELRNPTVKKKKRKKYKTNSILIQKYLDQPLLYNNRKFDIRCYVLVDHCLNVYICREGHLKGCSEEYKQDSDNQFCHITNYSLQRRCENFSKYEHGNEISYQQFRDCLQHNYHKEDDTFLNIMAHMKTLVEISMNCIGKQLSTYKDILSFQIFGYDFIIDENFKPWILEINDNPGLEISSPLIEKLVPRMIDDAFRLTIDKVFDTVYNEECIDRDQNAYKSIYHLDDYNDYENVFEFICNINKDPYDKENLKRSCRNK